MLVTCLTSWVITLKTFKDNAELMLTVFLINSKEFFMQDSFLHGHKMKENINY